MRTLIINIPDNLDISEKEITMLLASKFYEQGRLSLGQAASLAGVSKRTFTELLTRYDVSIFNYSPSEISRDVKNA